MAKNLHEFKRSMQEFLLQGIGVAQPEVLVDISKSKKENDEQFHKAEAKPMIFICTTLWHEEDNEMETLIKSLLSWMSKVFI